MKIVLLDARKSKRYVGMLLMVIIVVCLLEVTLFNYKHYITMNDNERVITNYNVSDGLTSNGQDHVYFVESKDNAYIEVTNIKELVHSIKIDVEYLPEDGEDTISHSKRQKIWVKLFATDSANELYFTLGDRAILSDIDASQYMIVHLAGETEKVKMQFSVDSGKSIRINSVIINPVVPMHVSFLRMGMIALIFISLYILRPKSSIYDIIYDSSKLWQRCVNIAIIVTFAILFIMLALQNPLFTNPPYEHHYQYQELAKSFTEGHAYLNSQPSEELIRMDNPYDSGLRAANHVKFLWDRVYYEGKYYVYFGVVPVLTYYLPGYLLMGEDVPTYVGMIITSIFFIIGLMAVLNAIVKRWFDKISYVVYIFMVMMFGSGCGILTMMIRPDFYTFPILMGITFSIWGLYLWITSIQDLGLSKSRLAAGSLCMALVAGCRPQLLIMSFVAIPLFWNEVFQEKHLILGQRKGNTFSFFAPYVIIATGIMYYNFIRFGSVLDFGATYNLTTNDMTNRGLVLGRSFVGLFTYLFQFPDIEAVFPFLKVETVNTSYLGKTISEGMLGGFLSSNILMVLLFFVFRIRKVLQEKNVYAIVLLSILSGVSIVIVDTQLAGILPRYVYDFAWMMFFAVTFVVFVIHTQLVDLNNQVLLYLWRVFLCISFVWGMSYNFCRVFVDTAEQIEVYNPNFFYSIAYKIAFWM